MRKDGSRIKITNPIYTVMPYILDKRVDSMNMIELDIPVAPMQDYMHGIRNQGQSMSHLGIVISAYLRTVAEFPLLNRFIVNKRIYQRNEFPVSMVVLKPGEHDGTMNKMFLKMEDTIFQVHEKINEYVETNRLQGDTNSTDRIVTMLLKIPGLCNFAVGVFKLMDRYGLLPKAIIDASPFHTGLCISNLASIRTNHIFHHCYEFGTTSIFITIGNMREVPFRVNGEIQFRRCLPMGVVMDERICSGSYFAAAFSRFKHYLLHPEELEAPPSVVNTILG